MYLSINCVVVATGSFSNIYPCTAGLYATEFCCGYDTSYSCCNNKVGITWGDPFAPSQDDTSFSTVSGSSSTSTTSSTNTSSSNQMLSSIGASSNSAISSHSASSLHSSNHSALSSNSASSFRPSAHTSSTNSTAIGVGIGVTLGLLLLLSLGFLFYRERQWRAVMKSLKREKEAALSNMWQRQSHDGYPVVSNIGFPHELEHTQKAIGELESRSVHEVAAKPLNGA